MPSLRLYGLLERQLESTSEDPLPSGRMTVVLEFLLQISPHYSHSGDESLTLE
jgi:hypothetical protein